MADVITEFALPGVLSEIAQLVGVDAAAAVGREFGGDRIYFRQDFHPLHPLVPIIGRRAAMKVCTKYAGAGYIKIPSARSYLRWYDARRLRRQGLSIRAVARELKITNRQAEYLLQGFPAEQVGSEPAAVPQPPRSGRKGAAQSSDSRQLRLL